jgi:hypothetical protein
MQSVSNLAVDTGVGTGYGFAWRNASGKAMCLYKFAGGLTAQTALSDFAFPVTTAGTEFVIQLHWAVSGTTIVLQAQAGLGSSYGALSALYSATIVGSALVSSAGEGFYAIQRNASNSALDVSMDVTQRSG